MLTFIKLKPLGKIAHLDMHDPWNRLRGNGTAILYKPRKKIFVNIQFRKSILSCLNEINYLYSHFIKRKL